MKTKIAFFRKKLNITQEELANAVGVTRQTILVLEQGKYNPSLVLAHNIAKALGQKRIEDVFKI
jgi:putative transcriptional regulator